MNSILAPAMDAGFGFLGGGAAHFGFGASAETGGAELQQLVGLGAVQRLRVGIGADEFHALNALGDHVVDGVAAATTDPDHLDLGALVKLFDHLDGHIALLTAAIVPWHSVND
jgi:hypothetical protein